MRVKSARFWLKLSALSVPLTVGIACSAFVNDLKGQNIPGHEQTYNSKQTVGTSAHDLLEGDTFHNLTVEIQYTGNTAPTQEALNKIQDFLAERVNKTITLNLPEPIAATGKSSLGVSDITAIEDQNRKLFPSKDRLVAYYLFVDAPGFP